MGNTLDVQVWWGHGTAEVAIVLAVTVNPQFAVKASRLIGKSRFKRRKRQRRCPFYNLNYYIPKILGTVD